MLAAFEPSMTLSWLLFVVSGIVVWKAGVHLANTADAIAERTGIGRAVLGFLFLATITELPELVTNSVGAWSGKGELVLNSMFGGITMQTTILVIADLASGNRSLTFAASQTVNLLQGTLLILLLTLLLAAMQIGDVAIGAGVFNTVGWGSATVAVSYIAAIYLMWRNTNNYQWTVVTQPVIRADIASKQAVHRELRAGFYLGILLAVLGILAAGVVLVISADAIAKHTGLGGSIIGATLLASATSLPEISTTIQSIRLNAYSMAISNIFGSNLIMILLVLPVDSIYREGLILGLQDPIAKFSLISGIAVTAIFLAGLIIRSRKTYLRLGVDSWLVLLVYSFTIAVLFHLRG